jgi:hypothetical protein
MREERDTWANQSRSQTHRTLTGQLHWLLQIFLRVHVYFLTLNKRFKRISSLVKRSRTCYEYYRSKFGSINYFVFSKFVKSGSRIHKNKQAWLSAESQVYERAWFVNIHKSAIKGTNSLCLHPFISSS